MTLSPSEMRARAIDFAHEYREATSERADAQLFWRDFFHVFGISARRVGAFEQPVRNLSAGSGRGRIDFLWKGRVLVEHKSRGENLDAAGRQARDYFDGLIDADLPRYILVSDFARIRLHDVESGARNEFNLDQLFFHIGLFGFLSGYTSRPPVPTDPVNQQATRALAKLHDLLEQKGGYRGRALDVWMVRTLFCLFADSANIFEQGQFRELIGQRTADNGNDLGAWMARLHDVLNTPGHHRPPALDAQLAEFRYVNGDLFAEPIPVPTTSQAMREALLDACRVDWKAVSPAIFGSLFQSIKDRDERRIGGEHYTTEENILKCLDPMFLDGLRVAANDALARDQQDSMLRRLRRIRVFDPACGCGNFLVVAYRELRRIELTVLKRRYGGDDAGRVASLNASAVNVDQFYGLEVDDWPAQIARVALWLTDHQMNLELSREFGSLRLRLPLVTAPRIRAVNALHEDWAAFCPAGGDVFCVGNPPFVGAKTMTASQRSDVAHVFGRTPSAGLLDYVSCWYLKAAEWLAAAPEAEACLISTNSITQGEQPAILWSVLWPRGVVINFAHRTFRWSSEARGKAAVHCVIIGFALRHRGTKRLWDYDDPGALPHEIGPVQAINPYLVDGPMVALPRRGKPLWDAPRLAIGNKPIDGGWFIFTAEERDAFLAQEPAAARYFHRYIGSEEYIDGTERWFLWLADTSLAEANALPAVRERIRRVSAFREGKEAGRNGRRVKDAGTMALADRPTQLHVRNTPEHEFFVLPKYCSETRRYIPMGYVGPETRASDLLMLGTGIGLYHFGVLTSTMHMAWVRGVCGRIKSDYRYSVRIVYNNFPWPALDARRFAAIEAAAQEVLDVRTAYFETYPHHALADIYAPLVMPRPLYDAHRKLDRAVDAAYAVPRGGFATEASRLAFLFTLYQAKAAPLDAGGGTAKRPIAKRRRRTGFAEEQMGLLSEDPPQ